MFLPDSMQGQDILLKARRVIFDVSFVGATPSSSVRHATDVPGAIFLSSQGRDEAVAEDSGCNFGALLNDSAGSGSPLASADNFAVLASSTITNTGGSVITGDLGLSPGTSVTGFPPGSVVGTQHIADANAAQAQIDLSAAYIDFASRVPTANLTGQDLGTLTLPPGVYKYNSSAQLTGTVVLDASGDANAVWVFQIGSTLTTASSSVVSIINSGQAGNVFWQVGSSATLGTSSTFKGNILAQASITATTSASVDGRLLARTGAVTLDTNAVTKNTVTSGGASLVGVLVHGPKCLGGIVKKLFSIDVSEITNTAGTVSRALVGSGITGITDSGNIAFTIAGTDANLDTDTVTYRCVLECAIDEAKHE